MAESWMYTRLLAGIGHDYRVTSDDRVIYYDIDVGSVQELARLPSSAAISSLTRERIENHKRKEREKKQMEDNSNATRDGKLFGEFLLWMNPRMVDFPDMWNISMLFGKLLGYNTLESGIQFVSAVNGVLSAYRSANTKMIASQSVE